MTKEQAIELLTANGFTKTQAKKVVHINAEFKDEKHLLSYAYTYFGAFKTSVEMLYKAFIYHTNFKPCASILLDDYVINHSIELYLSYDKAKKIAIQFIEELAKEKFYDFFGYAMPVDKIIKVDSFKHLFGLRYYYYRTKRFVPYSYTSAIQDDIHSISVEYSINLAYINYIEYTRKEFLDYVQDCNFYQLTYALSTPNSAVTQTLTKDKSNIIVENNFQEIIGEYNINNIQGEFYQGLTDKVYVLNRVHNKPKK